jgi:hypothetical protein
MNSWAKQLALYLAALLIMKIFVLVLFAFTLDSVLLPLAGWILNWMRTWSQVVFVMAIFPLFMNVIQVSRRHRQSTRLVNIQSLMFVFFTHLSWLVLSDRFPNQRP